MTNPSSNDTAAPTAPTANLTGSPEDASLHLRRRAGARTRTGAHPRTESAPAPENVPGASGESYRSPRDLNGGTYVSAIHPQADGTVRAATDLDDDGNVDAKGILDAQGNVVQADAIADGVVREYYRDTNGDVHLDTTLVDSTGVGQFDTLILDSDGDDVPNTVLVDTDSDGIFDLKMEDTTNDGILDEVTTGSQGLVAEYDGTFDGPAEPLPGDDLF
ncbi:hypothetical protein [Rhodococcus sp. IEGM 1307]|uniref:hypothetical protein n=1 Tax=Rhodococcus sp. IEGM 1307 TaxID=3047091 RepID=UPI0024B7BEEC|nr:hypothetical protein [Rhodococcus sp. IEGM 1307]MDI9976752.1 hypothetical protein [Rhodococcus sp. IEGM 1307]